MAVTNVKEPLLDLEHDDADHVSMASSSSSSGEDSEDSDALEEGVEAAIAAAEAAQAAQAAAVPLADNTKKGSTKAKAMWLKAGKIVRAQVTVKLTFGKMAAESSKKLAMMEEKQRSWYVAQLFMMSVFLNVMDTEGKACAFHSSSVGKYSVDGKPYQFTYSLFVALLVFIIKLVLGPLEKMLHKRQRHDKKVHKMTMQNEDTTTPQPSVKSSTSKRTFNQSTKHQVRHDALKAAHKEGYIAIARRFWTGSGGMVSKLMPWVLLVAFTLCEMMSATISNYALNVTPTSVFIVFKSSKMVIVAVASWAFMGASLRKAQWVALVLLVVALLIAVVAESKGGSKHGGSMSLQGPILLLLSELFYALMLIFQQIAVRDYWPDPMLLVSASAIIGIPITLSSMAAARKIASPLPPYHPVSDYQDVFIMCSNSASLSIAILSHLFFRVTLDAFHIVSAKHLSPLARAMTDVVKLAIMWVLGKLLYLLGSVIWQSEWPQEGGALAVLSEPWRPNSWMMIPGLVLIGYALLMYKFRVYTPIWLGKDKDGKWELQIIEAEATEEEKQKGFVEAPETGFDDGFYSAAFNSRKVRTELKHKMGKLLATKRGGETVFHTNTMPAPANQTKGRSMLQKAALNIRNSQANAETNQGQFGATRTQ